MGAPILTRNTERSERFKASSREAASRSAWPSRYPVNWRSNLKLVIGEAIGGPSMRIVHTNSRIVLYLYLERVSLAVRPAEGTFVRRS